MAEDVSRLDLKAWRVQNRLVCVTMDIICNYSKPKIFPKEQSSSKKRTKTEIETQLSEALQHTAHMIRESPSSIKCTVCLKFSPRGLAHLWLGTACNRASPSGIHASHVPHLRTFRGLRFCARCGGLSSKRLRTLKLPCPQKISTSGRKVLNRIQKGSLPFGMKSWPDQE